MLLDVHVSHCFVGLLFAQSVLETRDGKVSVWLVLFPATKKVFTLLLLCYIRSWHREV